MSEVETEVDESPTEIVHVKVAAAVAVHCLEDLGEVLYTSRRTGHDLRLKLLEEVVDVKTSQSLDRRGK